MKLSILKVVTKEPTIHSSEPATMGDKLPPLIHAAAPRPLPPGRVRRLDVDAVLARSLPKLAEGFEKAA